jgi:hypothetical protein
MIDIIAHRGFWKTPKEKNTIEAFHLALKSGFGIETDFRDFNGEIVISHDIPNQSSMTLKKFLEIVDSYPNQTLALNIKSDGLQHLLEEVMLDKKQAFVFDMSIPDTLGYMKNSITFYSRFSDLEPTPGLLSDAKGVWFDCFLSNELNVKALEDFLIKSKKVVLVSPELHGYEYQEYWKRLKNYIEDNPKYLSNLSICTDFPIDAKEYFCE